jgi:predicted transposase/invertase (TIGR01784 family)
MLYIDPKNDIAFRRLFGRESNKDITISLLNSVLDLQGEQAIKHINFLGTHLFPESLELRESIVDILCEDQKGQRYIVELQVLKPQAFDKRVLYYASKAYVDQLAKGEKYKDLKKVYLVGILNHKMFTHTQEYKTKHQIFDSATDHVSFKDFEFHIIELPKFNKTEDELETTEDKWMYFLKTAAQADHIPEKTQELEIKRAYDEMIELKWTAQERDLYHRSVLAGQDRESIIAQAIIDGIEKGIEKGRKEGIERGKEVERKAMINQLYKSGMDIDSIHKVTKIAKAELTKWIEHPSE